MQKELEAEGGVVMAFCAVERMQIKNAVEKVLHVTGNYQGGILEMAAVFDCNLSGDCVRRVGKDTAELLKSHSGIFRNVRLNTICWKGDGNLEKEVSSIPLLQMGRCFDGYRRRKENKRLELLAGELKKFYARSKLIFLFTDGNCHVGDEGIFNENMHPFLHRKLIVVRLESDGQDTDEGQITVHMGLEKEWMGTV